MARRLTTSVVARSSERADLRNFSRAGVAIEQLAHFDARAGWPVAQKAGGRGPARPAPPSTRISCASPVVGAAGDGQPRHRADGGQRLAAKAHRGDMGEIVLAVRDRQLGGGVALDRQQQIVRAPCRSPSSSTRIRSAPPFGGRDVDARGAGIERVLDQFLDGAGRALHHFARGDAVDGAFGEAADLSFALPLSR